jgi:hypothetical protein
VAQSSLPIDELTDGEPFSEWIEVVSPSPAMASSSPVSKTTSNELLAPPGKDTISIFGL